MRRCKARASSVGDGDGFLIGELADDDRNLLETRELRGLPAAFAGDDFVAGLGARNVRDGAHHDRLNDPVCLDRCREFLERLRRDRLAWLGRALLDRRERQRVRHEWRYARTRLRTQERRESPAQAS
jgi:hypothetical protein